MTPIFALSLIAITALMVSIVFYLVQHVRRQDKAEESQTVTEESVPDLTIDYLAGIERKKVA